ncbi:ABC transporter permease subunit [Rhizobium leguminosarum]|uniref:ABC transporter permease subunit n=1 Tax=Rhizobium leguminosarum TaxID=384 RepID=A0A6P0AYH6_RHILE|nr:ABC transporter permease subunit [Rhizobium leguminosarum]NEI32627.1 ABC transporter permease subunit [Rhizobium leguminosarum]NEI39386.1 ABC transporter permease subunit [Rhizobium leguminosarum]
MSNDTLAALPCLRMASLRSFIRPHRLVLIVVAILFVALAIWLMRWDWVPRYAGDIAYGVWLTLVMLVLNCGLGFAFGVPIGLVQVTGPWPLARLARSYSNIIRGTPLLLQLWVMYYGLGSVLPRYPGIRSSFLWPILREAWPYAILALVISFAAYSGEVMRGAFAGVPRGELEAGRAFGMTRWTVFHRIWFPRAVSRVLPTLSGETVFMLKGIPLIATITVPDIYGVISKVRQETFIIYEPLLLLALIYCCLTGIIVSLFRYLESKTLTRR